MATKKPAPPASPSAEILASAEPRYRILFDACGGFKQGDVTTAGYIARSTADLLYLISVGAIERVEE
jgi:hypothetical protein